jgi:aldose 1-epimerase
MTIPLSGTQFELSFGEYTASIASVGATLRTLAYAGRDLIAPFDADELRPAYRGAILAPWPNRIVDGKYTLNGVTQQLALTEPERSHALHGLASWLDFIALEESSERLVLATTIEPQSGYPYRLQLRVEFTLDADGLRTTMMARNIGQDAAPYGTGPHPYLIAGEGSVDEWTLTLPAERVLTVTDERLIPIGLADVATEGDGALDFRTPRVVGGTMIDHAFTGLTRDGDGTAEVRLIAPSGTGVAMRWSTGCNWVQLYTSDQADPALSRRSLAVEPMTCPPDAFNSGTDLIMLKPGQLASVGWTIAAL